MTYVIWDEGQSVLLCTFAVMVDRAGIGYQLIHHPRQ